VSEALHTRAQKLFAQSIVEELGPPDRAWLDVHLHECADCAREIATMRELLGALRSVPVTVPSDLVTRTQLRVRLRAEQSSETSSSSAWLWIVTVASWLLGIFSAPLVWRGFAWVGERTNLPKPVLELGLVLWWALPALIAVAVVLHQRAASSRV
jgi:anti-sigma factor RsiW